MIFRTDLAIEYLENRQPNSIPGVVTKQDAVEDITITTVTVQTGSASEELQKPKGTYITVDVVPFSQGITASEEEIEAVASSMGQLLPKNKKGPVLVVGLGNTDITPDALGPRVIQKIIATRHISEEIKKASGLQHFSSVCALAPGVLGQTGIETGEIVAAVVAEIRPRCVVVVDALASRSLTRLGTTIQISNTGISPGSGVQNSRKELSEDTLHVPVISIGVPTVVDAVTLAYDLLDEHQFNGQIKPKVQPNGAPMIVTPREIDLIIKRASDIIAFAINKSLHPKVPLQSIQFLLS